MMNEQQLERAEKHIKYAWIAGTISATITFLFSMVGAFNDEFRIQYGLDTWSLIDVALIAGLAYGVYRKNRFCALGLLIYFVLSKFILAATSGQFAGGVVSLLFAYFYFQGTRATFQMHKHLVKSGEIVLKKGERGLGFYVSVFFGTLVVLSVVFLIVLGATSPDIEVIPGKQVDKEYLDFVWDQGIVDPSEEIQFWYSDAFSDFTDGFYLFTDKKVVIYSSAWSEPAIIIPYSQIVDIEFEQDPSFIEDSRITLVLVDNSTVYFPVSSENGGDYKFHERLVEVWNSN